MDKTRLAGSHSEVVIIYTLPDLKEEFKLQHESVVEHISFSPNGRQLLTVCGSDVRRRRQSYSLKVWDLEAEAKRQQEIAKVPLQKADMSVMLQEMMKAAKSYLLQYPADWNVDLFASQAEEELQSSLNSTLQRIENNHKAVGAYQMIDGDFVPSFGSVPWSPSGKQFLSLQYLEKQPPHVNGRISDLIVWDATSWKKQYQLTGHDGPIMWSGFSPDGKWIASSSWDLKVRIWAADTGHLIHTLADDSNTQGWTGRFSPDSKLIAVGNGDGYLRIWATDTGDLRHKFSFKLPNKGWETYGRGWIRGIAWSKNSKMLFAGDVGGSAILFDLETGRQLQRFDQQTRSENSMPRELSNMYISSDGNRLAFPVEAGEIVLYDIAKNERWSVVQALDPQQRLPEHSDIVFLDDQGSLVLSGDSDGHLRVWKLTRDA